MKNHLCAPFIFSPSNKIIRIYKVKVQGIIDLQIIKKIEKGLIINKLNYPVFLVH